MGILSIANILLHLMFNIRTCETFSVGWVDLGIRKGSTLVDTDMYIRYAHAYTHTHTHAHPHEFLKENAVIWEVIKAEHFDNQDASLGAVL